MCLEVKYDDEEFDRICSQYEDKRESYFDKDFEEAEWEQLLQKEEEYCKIQEKIDAEEREKERQKLLNTKKSTFLYDFSGDDSSLNLSFW